MVSTNEIEQSSLVKDMRSQHKDWEVSVHDPSSGKTQQSPRIHVADITVKNQDKSVTLSVVKNEDTMSDYEPAGIWYNGYYYADMPDEILIELVSSALQGNTRDKKRFFGLGKKVTTIVGKDGREYWPQH